MIKIVTADQIKAWDEFTIREESIASIDLMERACQAFVTWFVERISNCALGSVVLTPTCALLSNPNTMTNSKSIFFIRIIQI